MGARVFVMMLMPLQKPASIAGALDAGSDTQSKGRKPGHAQIWQDGALTRCGAEYKHPGMGARTVRD